MSHHVLPLSFSLLLIAGFAPAEDSSTAPLVGTGGAKTASGESYSTHSWDAPALTVQGPASDVHEAQRIGSYGQPRWAARRLFTETRTYVIPEGQIEFEYWLTVEDHARNDDDGESVVKQQYEVEMGLPYRFQLDIYQSYEKEGSDGPNEPDAFKTELRWAFANWDVIFGNPTAYLEWEQAQGGDYDTIEGKLLFCDEITDKLRWAANAVWEEKTGGDRERSQELTGGISYGVIDSKFAVGAEAKFGFHNTIDKGGTDERTPYQNEFLMGPSIQFRPAPQMHIDAAWLAGTTSDSPRSKFTAIAGWEF